MVEIQMNTFTVQELADFYQKLADGSKIDYALLPKDSFGHPENGPHLGCSKDLWRIKPTKKVIDLSVLVESGIDCEFSDGCFDHLKDVSVLTYIKTTDDVDLSYNKCRPRMNHIHAWQGGECPLPEGFKVKVWYRDGSTGDAGDADKLKLRWSCESVNSDIIQFEVLGLADGYVMPWEQELEDKEVIDAR